MPAKRFDSSNDPAFDLRAAEIAQAATVQRQAADAADGPSTNASTPMPDLGGDDPSTIEQIANDLGSAAEDALLAGLAAAPPVAAVAAIINQGEELLEAAEDGAKWVGGALDDIGGLFAVDKVVVGESTFPVDPDAVPQTREESETEVARIMAEGAAIRANQEHFDELGGGSGYVFNANPDGVTDPLGDIRLQDTVGLDTEVTTGVTPTLNLDPGIVGDGAIGGAVSSAPDGVMEPVAGLSPDVAIGAMGGAVTGAPDNVFEPLTESDAHVTIGAAQSVDPAMAGPGAAGGNDVIAPDGVMEPVAGLSPDVAIGADPRIDVNQLPTADLELAEVPVGADVQLNPQPIPPGMGAHIGAEVSLNPQPIPPGRGADIGVPVAQEHLDHAPSLSDSSTIVVGGTEAPLLAGDTGPGFEGGHEVNIAEPPIDEDVASTLAADVDGPAFRAVDIDEPGVDVGFSQDEFES